MAPWIILNFKQVMDNNLNKQNCQKMMIIGMRKNNKPKISKDLINQLQLTKIQFYIRNLIGKNSKVKINQKNN